MTTRIEINEKMTDYGQPVTPGERVWVRLTGSPKQVGEIVQRLAEWSVEFTFEPYPDDEYEITVKGDQMANLEAALA